MPKSKQPPSTHSAASADRPLLSLCMIVRDNERTLDACLAGIRPWVDEIILVDTGSVDQTVNLARKYNARVYHFPWVDDFSAARNESLRHARGKWLFWMDSDDTIDVENGRKLRVLAAGNHEASMLGYVLQVRCPNADSIDATDFTTVDHVKLFRNLPQLRFEGRIHEQVLPAIRRLNGEVGWTDVFVVHSGSDNSAAGRSRKYDRDLRILERDLDERPDHPFVLFNLGMTYADKGDYEEAVRWLQASLRVSASGESHLRKVYALLVNSLYQLRRFVESADVCRQGRELFPDDPELLFRQGMLRHEAGELVEAERSYLAVLDDHDDRHFASIDSGIVGFKAKHNLALVYEDMQRLDLAEFRWREVMRESNFKTARQALGENLLRQRKFTTAQVEAERMLTSDLHCTEGRLLLARLAEVQGDLDSAREHLDAARRESPDSEDALRAQGRFHFEHGEFAEAKAAIEALLNAIPDDAAGHHNLGTALMALGEPEAALEHFRESLRLRPDSGSTAERLAEAVDICRRLPEYTAAITTGDP